MSLKQQQGWLSSSWLRYLSLAIVTAWLVWSCQATVPQNSAGDRVTLKLGGWGSSPAEQRLFQQLLDEFQSSHPQIEVRFEAIADQYMDVMKTRLIGDAAPDVFFLDSLEAPFLIANDVIEPLDRYITPEFDLADFEEPLIAPFRYQGKLYGLPKDCSTLALFYNPKAFAEVGLTAPPTTWEELQSHARLLTLDHDQDGKVDQFGLGFLPDLARLVYIMRAFGGEAIDAQGKAAFASAPSLQGLDLVLQQYLTDRTSARPPDVGANSGTEMFGQARAAMVIEGNWAVPFLRDTFPELEFATAEVPTINSQPGTMVFTVGYVINQASTHKPAAWELIRYLTGKDGMTRWTSAGLALPTRRSVSAQLQANPDPIRKPLLAGIKYATPWQLGLYPAAILNSFNNQFTSVILGQQPLAPALKTAQASANRQIQAAKEE